MLCRAKAICQFLGSSDFIIQLELHGQNNFLVIYYMIWNEFSVEFPHEWHSIHISQCIQTNPGKETPMVLMISI